MVTGWDRDLQYGDRVTRWDSVVTVWDKVKGWDKDLQRGDLVGQSDGLVQIPRMW